jgi:chemotaxis response regulator CheB
MAARPVVMVIDDDPVARQLLSTRLVQHGGFRIGGVAADGLEGALLAADVDPDVVIMDHVMPRWDGPKAADFIRRRCPSALILALADSETTPPWADSSGPRGDPERVVSLVESMCVGF